MKFRTEISIPRPAFKIGYDKPILMIGSCFTENIGAYFNKYLFDTSINPFGVTFNPFSISNGIQALLNKEMYSEQDLGHYNELFFSFNHYTKFSDPEKEAALKKMNSSFLVAKEILTRAPYLILTFGTAFVFEYKKTGQVVNNCHKIPAREFSRRLLSVEEIVSVYSKLINIMKKLYAGTRIIFTVSPVRHLKDGLIENQKSKSILILSAGELVSHFPEHCAYFPSYEILMDDLRDYRFYAEDLLHPNEQAVDYTWQQFRDNYFEVDAIKIIKELDPLLKAMSHRPLHPNTKAFLDFQDVNAEKLRKLKNNFPFLKWSELGHF